MKRLFDIVASACGLLLLSPVLLVVAMGLMIAQLFVSGRGDGLFGESNLLVDGGFVLIALVVCVGATNIYNFMDGINGITGGYSLSVLLPLLLIDCGATGCDSSAQTSFVPMSLIVIEILADLVFCFFNFRPKGKAKCFAGDVGSIGIEKEDQKRQMKQSLEVYIQGVKDEMRAKGRMK